MKPFYGIDRTVDKKNTEHLGACFLAAEVSAVQKAQLEQAATELETLERRAGLPGWLNTARNLLGLVTALLFLGLLRGLGNVTLEKALENAPVLFWLLGIFAAVWVVLTAIHWRIRKSVLATEAAGLTENRWARVLENSWLELGVPGEAKDVDVLCRRHKWKNGKLKAATRGLEASENSPEAFRVFVREGQLCFARPEGLYAFPIRELNTLRRVKKHLMMTGWNKDEALDEGFYKPYKLTRDGDGRIHMRAYGLLELRHQGEDWAVWLPGYELNYIAALTGLPITE